jgi:hypothetical protein
MKTTSASILFALLLPFAFAQDRPEPPSAAVVLEDDALTPAEQAAVATGNNPYRTVLVYASPGAGGHVSGAGTYPRYTYVQISAMANAGWYFVRWNDGITNASRAFVLRTNISFTGTFSQTPPPPTMGYVTVGWNAVPNVNQYYVWTGSSSGSYTKRVTANNQSKKQLAVPLGVTTFIAVQSVDANGLVSTNYSNELAYTP